MGSRTLTLKVASDTIGVSQFKDALTSLRNFVTGDAVEIAKLKVAMGELTATTQALATAKGKATATDKDGNETTQIAITRYGQLAGAIDAVTTALEAQRVKAVARNLALSSVPMSTVQQATDTGAAEAQEKLLNAEFQKQVSLKAQILGLDNARLAEMREETALQARQALSLGLISEARFKADAAGTVNLTRYELEAAAVAAAIATEERFAQARQNLAQGMNVALINEEIKLAEARAALAQGSNQAVINAEQSVIAAREALAQGNNQALINAETTLAEARAALAQGSNQALINAEIRIAEVREALAQGANRAVVNEDARFAVAREALAEGHNQALINAEVQLAEARAALAQGSNQALINSEQAALQGQAALKQGAYQALINAEMLVFQIKEEISNASIVLAKNETEAELAKIRTIELSTTAGREQAAASQVEASREELLTQALREQVAVRVRLLSVQDPEIAAIKAETAVLKQNEGQQEKNAAAHRNLQGALRGTAGALGGLWLSYGAILPMMAAFAAASTVKSSFTQGSAFAHELTGIKAISEESIPVMGRVQEQLLALSSDTFGGPKNAAEGLRILVQAGYEAEEAMKGLPAVMNLAIVGEMSMTQAAETVQASIHAFNLELSDAPRIVDEVAKAAAISATSTAAMSKALERSSSVAQQFNMTLEEQATGLAVVAQTHLEGERAGTALARMMQDLANPSEKASVALQKLGIDAFTSTGEMKSLSRIMAEFQYALKGMTTGQRAPLLGDIFERRGLDFFVKLLPEVNGLMDEYNQKIRDSVGFSAQAADKLKTDVFGTMEIAASRWGVALDKAFLGSEKDIQGLANGLKDAAGSKELEKTLTTTVKAVTVLGQGVLALTEFLRENGDAVKLIAEYYALFKAGSWLTTGMFATTKALEGLTTAQKGLNAAIMANPWLVIPAMGIGGAFAGKKMGEMLDEAQVRSELQTTLQASISTAQQKVYKLEGNGGLKSEIASAKAELQGLMAQSAEAERLAAEGHKQWLANKAEVESQYLRPKPATSYPEIWQSGFLTPTAKPNDQQLGPVRTKAQEEAEIAASVEAVKAQTNLKSLLEDSEKLYTRDLKTKQEYYAGVDALASANAGAGYITEINAEAVATKNAVALIDEQLGMLARRKAAAEKAFESKDPKVAEKASDKIEDIEAEEATLANARITAIATGGVKQQALKAKFALDEIKRGADLKDQLLANEEDSLATQAKLLQGSYALRLKSQDQYQREADQLELKGLTISRQRLEAKIQLAEAAIDPKKADNSQAEHEVALLKAQLVALNAATQGVKDNQEQKTKEQALKFADTIHDETLGYKLQIEAINQQTQALSMSSHEADVYLQTIKDRNDATAFELALARANEKDPEINAARVEDFKRSQEAMALAERNRYTESRKASVGATRALKEYAEDATNAGGNMNRFMSNSFSSLEDAIVSFATTGKASVSDMVNGILADFARLTVRQSITGPLASLASSAIASYFGVGSVGGFGGAEGFGAGWTSASEHHNGGMVGSGYAPTRFMPAGLFSNAPRFHNGLAPDEFPAILQSGERVLSRQEVAGGSRSSAPTVNVTVVNNIANAQARTEETPNASGGKDIRVVIDEIVAANMASGKSKTHRSMAATFGITPNFRR